jgi:phosphopantothenoylcysteine decarboxylase/phosphopantothenate--cysteine ligase
LGIEHPSRDIVGRAARTLLEHHIILGVTSSISLYRSIDLARELMRRGAEVYPVLSPKAAELISPEMWRWATGHKPYVRFAGELGHISLSRRASGMVIAPATANTIAKIAYGIADTSVTLVAHVMIGMGKKVVVVPAMHEPMYRSPVLAEALKRCKEMGVSILPPVIEEGKAKIPSHIFIADKVEATILRGEDLKGVRIVVTAGPTREHLDPVRFISNPSSGKMGVAIASEAYYRGAYTHLIHGPISIQTLPWIKATEVTSAEEMLKAIERAIELENPEAIVLAAAPADFRFSKREASKIPSEEGPPKVKLELTPKIAEHVRRKAPNSLIVGFAAETVDSEEELVERAYRKLRKYGFDYIVANYVGKPGTGFGYDTDEAMVIDSSGKILYKGYMLKREWARIVVDIIAKSIGRNHNI